VEDAYRKFFFSVVLVVVTAAIGLLMAFPVMWCWNYALVAVAKLPSITWGQAWCLLMLSHWLLKSNLYEVRSRRRYAMERSHTAPNK